VAPSAASSPTVRATTKTTATRTTTRTTSCSRFVTVTLALCLWVTACGAPAPAPAPAPSPTSPPPPPASPTATSTPATGGALVEAALGNLSRTLHPYPDGASYTQAWIDVAALIWGGADGGGALLAFDWDTLDYRPAMARQMPQVSGDGKSLTFTLRDDLRWSDSSPLSAEDFQFAYDQASREDNGYVQLNLVQEIATYRTPDPHTIQVSLKQARPRPLALAIANVITPVPKKAWSGRSWTDASSNPEILSPSVVLGPYAVQDFKPSDRGVFAAVDSFYAGKPRIPRVEILANQQPAGALESLSSGRANWVHALPPDEYQAAHADATLSLKAWTAANAAYRTLEFNLTRAFLSDRRVRQALALAVNRADLLAVAEQGLGTPQYSFVQPSNTRWLDNAVEHYDVDLGKARQLLRDAGYALQDDKLIGKDGQPIRLQVVYPTSSAPRGKIAAYLQQQYGQLGITVDIKGLDFNAYTDQVQARRDFDISLASYGGGSIDPELGARAQLITNGQQNVTGYSNAQVDELFRQAALELDESKRKQLYDQIQMLVNADVPSHYLYALTSLDVFSSKVHGVATHQGDRLDDNSALLSWSVDP
jgi:peptide/nickel transport system substrate-binding protein